MREWTDGPVRIDIPAVDPDVGRRAGQIVIDAIVEAGLDPRSPKVVNNPMLRSCLGMWGRGEWTRADFVRAMQNLAILNPGLKPARSP